MRYRSTRGDGGRPPFASVLLDGLAPDRGLFVPETWPQLQASGTYQKTVAATLRPFVNPDPLEADLEDLAEAAYAHFRHPEIAPLRDMGSDRYLMELFWGPTLAFKDHALQMLGQLFDQVLARQDRKITVLGATSGDTGSAAIAACSGRQNIDVVILYPEGRITEFQRRQMTTVPDENVRAVAVAGSFDDCQDLVKQAFADPDLTVDLVAVNSINFARVAAQAAYYLWGAAQLDGGEVDFAVPTGNFGNVFSGWVARQGGANIGRLIIANNQNHGLFDLVENGVLTLTEVDRTLAPSMDVGIPSNLERYLFEVVERDAEIVRAWQDQLRSGREIKLDPDQHQKLRADFVATWSDDSEVNETIKHVYEEHGVLIDPHTAVGWEAGSRHKRDGIPMINLATADPVKFSPAVLAATGVGPPIPKGFETLLKATERTTQIDNEYRSLASLLIA